MINGWMASLKSRPIKETLLGPVVLVVLVLTALWIFKVDEKPIASHEGGEEFGITIPRGFLLLPLELANADSISGMIRSRGVVDVFLGRRSQALAVNLRVIKLQSGEGPVFGALIPEVHAPVLQDLFSKPGLRAAVKPIDAGKTSFGILGRGPARLVEIAVEED
jgi:hypothetical protein